MYIELGKKHFIAHFDLLHDCLDQLAFYGMYLSVFRVCAVTGWKMKEDTYVVWLNFLRLMNRVLDKIVLHFVKHNNVKRTKYMLVKFCP